MGAVGRSSTRAAAAAPWRCSRRAGGALSCRGHGSHAQAGASIIDAAAPAAATACAPAAGAPRDACRVGAGVQGQEEGGEELAGVEDEADGAERVCGERAQGVGAARACDVG